MRCHYVHDSLLIKSRHNIRNIESESTLNAEKGYMDTRFGISNLAVQVSMYPFSKGKAKQARQTHTLGFVGVG
jgi:hypothetical protein